MEAKDIKGERLLRVRNPWGNTEWQGKWSDGSEQWTPEWMQLLNHRFGDDGMFWISYQDFLRKYQSLDRTRLFGPEWQVTQQWTTVNVPWSADYNDTMYSVTVTQPGPVVIVLSQLDSRYFRGLEGQYTFQLHFRLQKDGDDSFVIRSHSNYSMSRSVSTDIELEPGTYSVLMKITAKRYTGDLTPDQIIRTSCMERPEKLIQVGLSYDLAHAKGQIKETEKEKAVREKREQKKKAEDHQKRRAELRAEMLKNWETGKKRLARTKRQEKRKEEYFKKRAENAKAAEIKRKETELASGTKANREQSSQGGSEAENIGTAETKDGGPPTPPIETPQNLTPPTPPIEIPQNGAGATAWGDEDEAKAGRDEGGGEEEVEGTPADANVKEGAGDDQEPASADEAEEAEEEGRGAAEDDNDDWEYASDASFQSSIVTELDLPPLSDQAPDSAPVEDDEPDVANAEFEDDPWNAVCVVGLKVYSKDKGLCVQIVRPKHEVGEGDTPLDVDDASKGQTTEKIDDTTEEVKEKANPLDVASRGQDAGRVNGTIKEEEEDTNKE